MTNLKSVLTEKEAKIGRATKRYESELKQRKEKERTIVNLQKTLSEDLEKVSKLKVRLAGSRKYQTFLEKVLEHSSSEFTEVSEILARFRTLNEANRDLTRRSVEVNQSVDRTRGEFRSYSKEQTNVVLNYNNTLSKLRQRLETFEGLRLGSHNEVRTNARAQRSTQSRLGRIFMAVSNLRQRCTSKFGTRIMHAASAPATKDAEEKTPSADSQDEEASAALSVARKCKLAQDDLRVIMRYIQDFSLIVEDASAANAPAPKK